MEGDSVERLHHDLEQLKDLMHQQGEYSFVSRLEDAQRKAVLLAAASNHEQRIRTMILNFVEVVTGANVETKAFVENKALARQYHTLFNWDGNNANSFFKLFGPGFSDALKEAVNKDDALAEGVQAFLEIGNDRNRLVHGDYASFTLEKTAEEIIGAYRSAEVFLEKLAKEFESRSQT